VVIVVAAARRISCVSHIAVGVLGVRWEKVVVEIVVSNDCQYWWRWIKHSVTRNNVNSAFICIHETFESCKCSRTKTCTPTTWTRPVES